jgi:hypothetical protein
MEQSDRAADSALVTLAEIVGFLMEMAVSSHNPVYSNPELLMNTKGLIA